MNNLRNSVQLIGHIGKDAEVKKLPKGAVVANTSIATKETYKNAEGEYVNQTTWHKITGWDKMADNMEKFLLKGREVAIQGKLTHRSYDDKNGIKRYVTEIRVLGFELLGKNPNKSTAELDVAPEKEGVMPF
ncbi:MAG: single-stranded DNA-binding protein [Saprospiraceae bacterium]